MLRSPSRLTVKNWGRFSKEYRISSKNRIDRRNSISRDLAGEERDSGEKNVGPRGGSAVLPT